MPGLSLQHVKYEVVEPALVTLGMMSTASLNLVSGTALVESGCEYLKQIGGGPALGLFQMEPATEEDCWTNFLNNNRELKARVQSLLAPGATTGQLVTNMAYAAAMCRLKYYRSPLALPAYNDAAGLADYHKSVYNSALGAADATTNTPLFQQAIDA